MNLYHPRVVVIAALLAVVAATGANCGKAIPVQELAEARIQIDAAQEDGAPQYATETYEQARLQLLNAHRALADEDYESAQTAALQATGLALNARETSAPKMVASKKETAEETMEEAEQAYAEVLAAQDYEAAQTLYREGSKLQSDAGQQKSAGSTAEDPTANLSGRAKALNTYSTAGRKFDDAAQAAERAKNTALAQKDDMLDSLDGIRSNLQRAEQWGAGEEDPDGLAAAKAKLSEAESLINDGKLKDGSVAMKEAEEASKQLLARVAAQYAEKKLAEAKTSVSDAEKNYGEINTPANRKDQETGDVLDTIGAQLGAAKEARDTASSEYDSGNYEQSISESEDAIRLSQIIFEQYNLLATAQKRDAGEIGEGGTDGSEGEETETPEGWRAYVVKKQEPADCLWCIAARKEFYGNGRLWKRIYQANEKTIRNPNLIFPGQKLLIPPQSGDLTPPAQVEETPMKEEEDSMMEDESAQDNENETMSDDSDTMDDESMTDEDPEAEEQPDEAIE